MGGITMWIILGALVAIVAGFLIVSSIIDRKKRKKSKAEELIMKKQANEAEGNVAIVVNIIVKHNQEILKSFIPSIGKYKMKDINHLAKKELKAIKKTDYFSALNMDLDVKEEIMQNLNNLIISKSNNWTKKCIEQTTFFQNIEADLKAPEDYQEFKIEQEKNLAKEYGFEKEKKEKVTKEHKNDNS